jgi:hypothetical protein
MRLFQNSGLYPSYLHRLNELAANETTFDERRRVFLNDRFGKHSFKVDHSAAILSLR